MGAIVDAIAPESPPQGSEQGLLARGGNDGFGIEPGHGTLPIDDPRGLLKEIGQTPFGSVLLPILMVTTILCRSTGALLLLFCGIALLWLSTRYQTLSGFDIMPVVGFVKSSARFKPNPGEVADVFETPFAFLMDPKNHERRSRETPDGMKRHFYAMPYGGQLIWGVTAGILRILYERLYGQAPDPQWAVERIEHG